MKSPRKAAVGLLLFVVALAGAGCGRARTDGRSAGGGAAGPSEAGSSDALAGVSDVRTVGGTSGADVGRGARLSGFDRFYSYSPPAYRASTAGDALPIPVEKFAARLEAIEVSRERSGFGPFREQFGLDDAGLERLAKQGFVVLRPSAERPGGWFDQFGPAYRHILMDAPVYVTADSVLHLYHQLFDHALTSIEKDRLASLLGPLMAGLCESARDALGLPGVAGEAAAANLAVVQVVQRLLNPAAPVYDGVLEQVEAEVAAIEAHAGVAPSAVFGYAEDYTQYVPRGHYTRDGELGRYFRAMMWLGRMTFLVRADTDPEPLGSVSLAAARRFAAQSALLARWLDSTSVDGQPARDAWQRIYRATAFFVGFADELTPAEVYSAATRVLGASWAPEDLADLDKLDALREAIHADRQSRILPVPTPTFFAAGAVGVAREDALAATAGMRFLGQRYVPDAEAMDRLVAPWVGPLLTGAAPFTAIPWGSVRQRGFARGLDVMTLLGSTRAGTIVESLGDAAYDGFAAALEKARSAFPGPSDPGRHGTLYLAWLDVLRELLAPSAPATQPLQTTDAWTDRLLNTALVSWTELRHDAILYADMGGGYALGGRYSPAGFVDPYPELYSRLRALGAMTRRGLEDLDLLATTPRLAEALTGFDGLLARLQSLAVSELEDRPFTPEDDEFLAGFADRLDGLCWMTGEDPTTVVADVQTDLATGEVLEEGSGALELLVAVLRIPGSREYFVAAGPVFSYHEFKHPMTERLTDEAWRELLAGDAPPSPPDWTCSFRHPCGARSLPTDNASAGGAAFDAAAQGPPHGHVRTSGGSAAGGSGRLSGSVFQQKLQQLREGIEHCYDRALSADAALQGEAVFLVRINERGGVKVEPAESSATLDATGVVSCVASQLRRLSFTHAPPEGGDFIVRVPFSFLPPPS
ncbi:MAG: DUF3160 domain-containing protein [Deltaproteobacteria bacterium]|nr:DUF3160 domain-containing protein [Deltaproteobacteria bacterium]